MTREHSPLPRLQIPLFVPVFPQNNGAVFFRGSPDLYCLSLFTSIAKAEQFFRSIELRFQLKALATKDEIIEFISNPPSQVGPFIVLIDPPGKELDQPEGYSQSDFIEGFRDQSEFN